MRKKMLIFHPTIAPYRIDFFNDLSSAFDTDIFLYYSNLKSQKFDYDKIQNLFLFKPHYMEKRITLGGRAIYKGHISEIIKRQPDIVLVGEYSFGAWCAVIARAFSKKKYCIITICDDSKNYAENCSGVRKISRNLIMRFLDGIILCNDVAQNWYSVHYKVQTFVFPIIQKDEMFRKKMASSASLAIENIHRYQLIGKKVYLFVGRLSEEKNIEYLVESFIYAHELNSNAVLLIIGDCGSSGENIMNSVKELIRNEKAGSYIMMMGRMEGENLYAFFNIGQVLILPSLREAFGAVTNEALLAGEYVMVSQNAGSACLVNEKNGEVLDVSKEYIDFSKINSKIRPLSNDWTIKESKMPFTYEEKMTALQQWLKTL